MKVFVALAYDRDHETRFCGIADDRHKCLRMISDALGSECHFSPYPIDGPEGKVAVDNRDGMVGIILHEEVQ